MRMKTKSRVSGFSLTEVLIYIIVSGVVLGLVMPAVAQTDKRRLRAALTALRSDLRFARRLAVTQNTNVHVVFDGSGLRYIVKAEQNKTFVTVREVKLSGVSVTDINAPLYTVKYNDRGTTSTACTIKLAAGAYKGGLTVNVGAGRVEIKEITKN